MLVIFTKKKNIDFRKKAFVSNLNQSMIFSSSQDSKSPDCCGSDTLNIQPTLLETGLFDRRAAAGSFQVVHISSLMYPGCVICSFDFLG